MTYLKRTDPGSVYEDASTVDPSALNEALTGTRPSDLENVDVFAIYDAPNNEVASEVTGVAEHPVADPGLQTNDPLASAGSTPGGLNPDVVAPGTEATWSTEIPDSEGRHSTPAVDDPGLQLGEPNPTPDAAPQPPVPGETPVDHPDVVGDTPSNEHQE